MLIIALSTLSNCWRLMGIQPIKTRQILHCYVNGVLNSIIPTILLTAFNAIMKKHLKALLASGIFTSGTNTALRKSIFRAKITMSITIIFLISQILNWIDLVCDLVCTCLHQAKLGLKMVHINFIFFAADN